MRRFLVTLAFLAFAGAFAFAKTYTKDIAKSSKADNLIGEYKIVDEQGTSMAKFYKADDGTYQCQLIGGKPVYVDGKLKLDEYNPEPSLRNVPIHQAIIISGMRYNAEEKQWDGGKIHNPIKRLEKADCTIDFVEGGKVLRVRGSLFGIGKSVYWDVK